jgi:hypothetical protein
LNRYEEEFSITARRALGEKVQSVKKAAGKCDEVIEGQSANLKHKYKEELSRWIEESEYQDNEKDYNENLKATSKKIITLNSDIIHFERQSKKADEVLVQQESKFDIMHKIKIDIKRALNEGKSKQQAAQIMKDKFKEKGLDYELMTKIYHEQGKEERKGKFNLCIGTYLIPL